MATASHSDAPTESAPDSPFAEPADDVVQPPSSSSPQGSQQELAEASFTSSLQDPDDDSLVIGAGTLQEGGRHPKARRKRTQAKDKSILEEAYAQDPKPNKETRLAIVQRVSLNEREVQIWFQNRRQNDRRKSRPLSAQELSQLKFAKAGIPMIAEPHASQDAAEVSHPVSDPAPVSSAMLSSSPYSRPSTSIQAGPLDTAQPPASSRGHVRSFSDAPSRAWQAGQSEDSQNKRDSMPEARAITPHSVSNSFSGTVGWLANRRNLGSSVAASFAHTPTKDTSSRPNPPFSSSQPSPATSENLSTSSFIRLRHSLDGQAQLVSGDASPVSVEESPEQPIVRQRTLQRSHTDLAPIRLPSFSTLTEGLPSPIAITQPPRLARGRSRDVHAWESCADADTQDELTALAERESNGSAVAAISIIRSSSNALQPSGSNKRNASLSRGHSAHLAKKSRLSRTTSSVARLESVSASPPTGGEMPDEKTTHEKIAVTSLLESPTDSDKENLTPDEDGNVTQQTGRHRRRRPLPSAAGGGPRSPRHRHAGLVSKLSANNRPVLLHDRAFTAPMGKRGGSSHAISIFEDSPGKRLRAPAGGDGQAPSSTSDVEKFMRGPVSPSKRGDMDCVEGLLSLSQGAWR